MCWSLVAEKIPFKLSVHEIWRKNKLSSVKFTFKKRKISVLPLINGSRTSDSSTDNESCAHLSTLSTSKTAFSLDFWRKKTVFHTFTLLPTLQINFNGHNLGECPLTLSDNGFSWGNKRWKLSVDRGSNFKSYALIFREKNKRSSVHEWMNGQRTFQRTTEVVPISATI